MTAKAPYNFVPLQEESKLLIPNQDQLKRRNVHDRFLELAKSGYIDLHITTLTPLFIRGKDNNFLRVNDQPIIPGSSLRGIIREMVEMMSFSRMYYVDNTFLFKRRIHGEGRPQAGFLKYDAGKGEYQIHRASSKQLGPKADKEFSYDFSTTGEVTFSTGRFGANTIRKWRIFGKVDSNPLTVLPEVYNAYMKEDISRSEKVPNVFECAKKMKLGEQEIPNDLGMPVFYTTDSKGNVDSISHCKLGRMPYSKRIHGHIPNKLLERTVSGRQLDYAEALFGSTEVATRVYFEDAYLEPGQTGIYLGTDMQPKILSSPKPTSYQLYLESDGNGRHQDWNSDAKIRGHKLYWHRKTPSDGSYYAWNEPAGKTITDSHPQPICPIKPGVTFKARIRFDNLNQSELGCLLTALQLPEDCAHKMGMAKPLGLGSVKMEVQLHLIDRKARYSSLFEKDSAKLLEGSLSMSKDEVVKFQAGFQDFLKNNLGYTCNYWEIDRMQELRAMLEWNPKENGTENWLEKTRYLEIEYKGKDGRQIKVNEYRERPVLPKPTKVKSR